MVQDETNIAADDAPAEPRPAGARYLLMAGVACACLMGAGLGLWARPALSERGVQAAEPAAADDAPAPKRKLQIVFDESPAPIGKPLEVMAPHPEATAPAPSPPAVRPPRPLPMGPPQGLMKTDAPGSLGPEAGPAQSRVGVEVAALAARAEPLAHDLVSSAHALLLRVAEVTRPSAAPGPVDPGPADPGPAALSRPDLAPDRAREARATAEARAAAKAERKAQADRRAAEIKARDAARALAQAQRLAEARQAAAEARAERRAEAEARIAARRVAEAKAERLAIAKAERARKAERLAEARAQAKAEARAEAKAQARRRERLAVLAHSVAKPARAARAAPAPRPKRTAPIRGGGPIRLASAPRCVSTDPGEALACADPLLNAAQRQMNQAYRQAEAAGVPEDVLRRQQERWLAARAAAAREAPWAVRDVYKARIAELMDEARSAHN